MHGNGKSRCGTFAPCLLVCALGQSLLTMGIASDEYFIAALHVVVESLYLKVIFLIRLRFHIIGNFRHFGRAQQN